MSDINEFLDRMTGKVSGITVDASRRPNYNRGRYSSEEGHRPKVKHWRKREEDMTDLELRQHLRTKLNPATLRGTRKYGFTPKDER